MTGELRSKAALHRSSGEQAVHAQRPPHLTNADIAANPGVVNTVKAHLKNIYAKLGVSTRAETVERARLL